MCLFFQRSPIQFLVLQLVFCSQIREFEIECRTKNLSNNPCVGLPFLLTRRFFPVMSPEVVIRNKNWTFLYVQGDIGVLGKDVKMCKNPHQAIWRRNSRWVFEGKRFHTLKSCKSTFFERQYVFVICCCSFRENSQVRKPSLDHHFLSLNYWFQLKKL